MHAWAGVRNLFTSTGTVAGRVVAVRPRTSVATLVSRVAVQNDLEIFRMRSKEHEIMAAPGPGGAFLLIVIQKWTPTSSEEYAAAAALLAPGAASAAGAAAAAGTGSK